MPLPHTPPEPRFRATFSFPATLAKNISLLSKRMGVSQSSLLTELLTEPIDAMVAIVGEIPPVGATPEHLMRARGRSADLIRRAVREAVELAGDE